MAFADVFGRDPLELWLLVGLAVVMLAALGRTAWRKRLARGRGDDIDPFLVFPEDTVRRPMTPAPIAGPAWAPPAPERDSEEENVRPPMTAAPFPPRIVPAPNAPVPAHSAPLATPERPVPFSPAPAASRPPWSSRPSPLPASAVDEASETIRLPTASDGTVQLLPGMLVVTEGPEVGREYRFLRIGNQPVPELTIGRASGPAYRHIQLPAATVSRMHARIRYEGGSWNIANLSMTNPLRLNGRELLPMTETPLGDGDRIQLGEVELSYRDGRL